MADKQIETKCDCRVYDPLKDYIHTLTKVNVLGTEYKIKIRKTDDDICMKERGLCGYCDEYTKEIVIADRGDNTYYQKFSVDKRIIDTKETLRHEIVHAFYDESGLSYSSNAVSGAWAKNEEMIDWIAIQGPKIYKAWSECNAL